MRQRPRRIWARPSLSMSLGGPGLTQIQAHRTRARPGPTGPTGGRCVNDCTGYYWVILPRAGWAERSVAI